MKKKGKSVLICRTCLQNVNIGSTYDETSFDKDSKTVREKLATCFPDLNLDATKNFVLCCVCLKRLSIIYKYFEDCMQVENKIMECIKNGSIQANSNWLDFSNVLGDHIPSTVVTIALLEECDHLELYTKIVKNGTNTPTFKKVAASDRMEVDTPYQVSTTTLGVPNAMEPITIDTLLDKPLDFTKAVSVGERSVNNFMFQPVENRNIPATVNNDVMIVETINNTTNTNVNLYCETCQSIHIPNDVCPSKQSIQKSNKCFTCNTTFINKNDLHRHLLRNKTCANQNTHNSEKLFKCHKCSASFKLRKSLNSHFISAHTTTFCCDWCNHSTKSFDKFKTHIQEHLNTNTVYKCNMCFSLYASKSSLDEHIITHLTCKCGQRFKFLESLQKHSGLCAGKNVPDDGSLHVCSVCKSIFKTKIDLDVHKLLHIEHTFKCDNCHVHFSSDDALLLHLQSCNKVIETSVTLHNLLSQGEVDQLEWINYDEQPIPIL